MSKQIVKKDRILAAAKRLFLAHGFEATSISQIAKASGVAKSLVFHHFPTKENLWRAVKADCISPLSKSCAAIPEAPASLSEFIEFVVMQRFKIYENAPELTRLIMWQQLAAEQDKLAGLDNLQADNWERPISYLQKKGQMTDAINPALVSVMIYGAVSNVFFDLRRRIFEDKAQLEAYQAFVVAGLIKALSP